LSGIAININVINKITNQNFPVGRNSSRLGLDYRAEIPRSNQTNGRVAPEAAVEDANADRFPVV